jgi:hypothetical protein
MVKLKSTASRVLLKSPLVREFFFGMFSSATHSWFLSLLGGWASA